MSQRRADLLLVLIALIWGTTFTIVHEAVATFPALALIALRFGCAAAVFLPTLARRRAELTRQVVVVGALLGALLFAGFASQTLGLQYTSPARAGFITGLNVVLVPLLGLGFGQQPPRRAVVGVALAVVGLAVLSWGCRIPWLGCTVGVDATPAQRLGDLLVLVCAFAFAMHIVAVSRWATTLPIVPINTVQLIVAALLATGAAIMSDWPLPAPSWGVWGAALFLGLVATALVFALQLKLQRYTTATHTALIFALEPVFAALFSWLWIGEVLTAAVWLGGGLMLLGVIVAEVSLSRNASPDKLAQVIADDVMLDGAR
ncbi:MAG TPA: DMT family transporter [Herpetosiphonaceae bacterium]